MSGKCRANSSITFGDSSLIPHTVVHLSSTSLGFVTQGAVILLSSGKDFTDEPGGEALLINSNFTGNKAHGGDGGVVYLNTYSNLTISGNSNR